MQALKEELDAANKKVEQYVNRVAMLSEELDDLQRSICHDCKKKFIPSYSQLVSSRDGPRSSCGNRIVSGPPIQSPPNTSIPIHPITTRQNQSKTASPPPPQVSSSAFPRRSETMPVDEIQFQQPDWSVFHNPDIIQTLHIDLVKTFNFIAKVYCVNFSPDGKYLAVGLEKSGKTYIYDVEKGLNLCFLVDLYLKNQPIVWCVQFSPDNKYIATACSDKRILLWDVARKQMRAVFAGHRKSVTTIYFSPDSRFLVAGDGDGSVLIWSTRDGSSKKLIDDARNILSVAFSPDGRHIASGDIHGWLRIWDVRTGHLLDTWEGHTQDALCVAFSPDGKGLVSGSGDAILRYWDVSSLADMKTGRGRVIGGTPGQRFQQIRTFQGHTALIRSVSFSPDGRWLATSSQDKSLRIWDPQTAEWQCTLRGHNGYVRTADFSLAGRYLASGGKDRQVRLWRYNV